MPITHPLQRVKSVAYDIIDRGLKPSSHYWFTANGQRFVYGYIRKNACSTFKNFIIGTSHETYDWNSKADKAFLKTHHGVLTPGDIRADDISFFVYRDPWDRLVSLYLNKLIVRPDGIAIANSYQKWTGKDGTTVSFSDFVQNFCAAPFKLKDPHIKPQSKHLFDIDYTHAVPMNGLCGFAETHFGPALAQQYFQTPANTTSDKTKSWTGDAIHASARDLKDAYQQTQVLPRKSDFADPHLMNLVKTRYAADYDLVQRHAMKN